MHCDTLEELLKLAKENGFGIVRERAEAFLSD